jgi:predicted O-methyltransferase YrrM
VIAADVRCADILRELTGATVVEIGVYVGRLSCRLLAADPRIHLHMVDPWAPTQSAAYKQSGDDRALDDAAEHLLSFGEALRAVEPYQGRYTVQRMTSEQACRLYADESVDMVFIDGDHSYQGCANDIRLWWPKVCIGGVLAGHDYRSDKDFGVIQAVQEFRGQREVRLGANYTWFITKESS